MESLNLEQMRAIAEKLSAIQFDLANHDAENGKYDRAYSKLQNSLRQFAENPFDETRANALSRAIGGYQTASQMLLFKLQNSIVQAKQSGVSLKDCTALAAFSEAMQANGNF